MKKRIICLCLALVFMQASASAAFSDISDSKLQQTASVLDALGIMQGVGNNRFSPDRALTRAQFCKLAVTALGFSDVSAYGSYTIFPDVKSKHWAAKYINAAVRHPEIKKQAIIRGYADGTFGPDKIVNFGEACTMLLRMLGYTENDIGPFWPADYIASAQLHGLTDGVSPMEAKDAVKRSDAAIMLLNTLSASMKEGEGLLIENVSSSTIKDCILLATSGTDNSLAANEALFFENGTELVSRRTVGTLDKSLIGTQGTLVIGKGENKAVLGIVPNGNKTESHSVISASASEIETDSQTLHPDRDTLLYIAREEKIDTFSTMWAGLKSEDELTLYYDNYGNLLLMAVLPNIHSGNSHAFVYGVANAAGIPQGYKIIKNDVEIDSTKLKKYDVVTLDTAGRRALVSDKKISGIYRKGAPSFSFPETVSLYDGQEYSISANAAESFASLELGEYITLLFDTMGNVVAAYPKRTVSADMQGIVTAINENKVTVSLLNGLTIKVTTDAENVEELFGRLVTVGQSANGNAYLTKRTLSGKVPGTWDRAAGKIGNSIVSPKVQIYEEVVSGAPLAALNSSDLAVSSIAAKDIRYTVTDNSGTITTIILGDVTGDNWLYGIGFGESDKEDDKYTVRLRYWDGTASAETAFPVLSLPDRLNGRPVGIPRGCSSSSLNRSIATLTLLQIDTVSRTAFDGSSGVRTKDGFYDLADEAGVYVPDRKEFISLQDARLNYSEFRLYANKTAENGGKIRVIIAVK